MNLYAVLLLRKNFQTMRINPQLLLLVGHFHSLAIFLKSIPICLGNEMSFCQPKQLLYCNAVEEKYNVLV